VPTYAILMFAYGASPAVMDAGYQPEQPVAYSHRLHAGELGIDCRYCHSTVEYSAAAGVPPTQTCMNCHANIYPNKGDPNKDKLARIVESYTTGKPVPWVRVHDLPDYVYFDHSAHINRGVGCVDCHGRIDTMDVVYQHEPLSMGWCLNCHRDPEPHLRPRELVTQMDWKPEIGTDANRRREYGAGIRKIYHTNPSTDCSTCHR
jgi:menaquinone reductase, multiheme cytochrome c subunit